ncbi:hypothetical protein PO909_022519 [Leuciscus waleckii]
MHSSGRACGVEGMEWSYAHTPSAEGELQLASAGYDKELEEDITLSPVSPLVLPSSKSPVSLLVPPNSKSSVSPEILPSLPLLTPLPMTASSSAPPPQFPLISLSPPLTPLCSVDQLGLQLHLVMRIPRLRFQPMSLSLHLGSPTSWLHLGSSPPWLYLGPPT